MSSRSSLTDSYWPTVAVALLALVPDLVLSTALVLVRPSIAADLGVSKAQVSWLATFSNSALAFGAVLGAALVQRFTNRRLFLIYEVFFVLGSVLGAVAPNVALLVLGHAVQGLSTGLLIIAALPPLLTRFPASRLRTTISFAVIGLFGAVTAGPLVGGYVAESGTWRLLFGAAALLGLVGLVLAFFVLAKTPPLDPERSFDAPSLLLSAAGPGLLFYGVGELMGAGLTSPRFYVPAALGALALVAVVALGMVRWDPLVPVGRLLSTFPVMGILIAVTSGAAFTGMLELMILFLQRVRGLGPLATGMLLWPDLAAGVVGAVVVGGVLTTRWVLTMPLFGMLLLALAAWRLTALAAGAPDGEILWISASLGLGASLTVTPGLLMAALSITPALVGRALALVQLLRLSSTYLVAPVLMYFALAAGSKPRQLLAGLHGVFLATLVILLVGIALITLVFVFGGARLHPPRFVSFLEEDEPALESPPLKRGKE